MKLLIFSDVHWSTYSSIIRKRGDKYSQRLELLLSSMNWLNEFAIAKNCQAMICCGDMMDKAQLNDEEITALQDIKWNSLPCYFLCGNHESSVSDLRFSALKALESPNHYIINTPFILNDEIYFLPYITESDRKPITTYFSSETKNKILISHADIAGINYGGFENKTGFSLSELSNNFSLVLNGHLHNSEWVDKKILNVGSLSAHNFTNDSTKYNYGAWILDTETLKLEFVENPYSLSFYKVEIESKLKLKRLTKLKPNSVISIKCNTELAPEIKSYLDLQKDNIIEYKLIISKDNLEIKDTDITELHGEDHIQRLISFCHEKLTNTEILEAELAEICK